MTIEFEPMVKIPRYSRGVVVTEKIDGTNAQVYVGDDGEVLAGSRNRWITPQADNHGFARWVAEHEDELRTGLGPGRHFGEWWGSGIQRRYGLSEKRFSLFNAGRWIDGVRPACCHVVPVLWSGAMDKMDVEEIMGALKTLGSQAAPGFYDPEGIVIYHSTSRQLFKRTFDDGHKGVGDGE